MSPQPLRSIMSLRSIDDIVAERIRLTFGDESFVIPIRSVESCERFSAQMDGGLSAMFKSLETAKDDIEVIYERLMPVASMLLGFVSEYDETGRLPPLPELRKIARPLQAIAAAFEVWRAVNPLADAGLTVLLSGIVETLSPAPTSSPPPPTDGRRGRSGANSPTNSSSSTSTPRPNGSPRRTSRASKPSGPGRSLPITPGPTSAGAPRPRRHTAARPVSPAHRSSAPS